MMLQFNNRAGAGEILAGKLAMHAGNPSGLVLALPRGGVPVAHAVAKRLGLPLDVFIVRKLGVPGHEELAMGAIASGGVCFTNDRLIASLHIPENAVAAVREKEQLELERRERQYRPGRLKLSVTGRTVILVDDGIATGASMRAAALALRKADAGRIVLAVPVAAPAARRELADVSDEFVAVLQPDDFHGVGQWYNDFTQVTDGEVTNLLQDSAPDASGC
jgi:predicted phosphoribosyltransferase